MPDDENRAEGRRLTTGRQRFMAGALGALVPVLLTLVTLELADLLANVDGYRIAGWAIRLVAMMSLGGVAAWYFSDSNVEPKVAFHLGMTWPAVFTAGGIGLQAGAVSEQAGGLNEQMMEVYAEVDSLQVLGTDSIDESHLEHLDSLALERDTVRRAPTTRVLDGVLGRIRIIR